MIKSNVFVCNGASNHTPNERALDDYYATEPRATELLLEQETFTKNVWECAVGGGHMAEVLKKHGYNVFTSDVVDRGYPGTVVSDFLEICKACEYDIVTNPPYKKSKEFIEKALEIMRPGGKIAMFLKLTFLEGKARKKLFEKYPPKIVYVSSGRLQCAKNGDFEKYNKSAGTAVAYAWFIWQKGYEGHTVLKWIN